MPPRIRELKQLATQLGWYKLRSGKGDHEIWTNDERIISFDGSDGREIPQGTLKSYFSQ
jgi:predicted RNA binding protein YcfA (HicA-like mRNA interferase family)